MRLHRCRPALGLILMALLISSCAPALAPPAHIDLPAQDAAAYLAPSWRVKPAAQAAMLAEFEKEYFKPWRQPDPPIGLAAAQADFTKFQLEPGLGENLLPRTPDWASRLEANAALAGYPNAAWQGLTLHWVNLRLMPSHRPSLSEAKRPGALSFDRLQQSLLPPNLPVTVHHITRDRAWLLVQTPIAWGWLPARSAARLTPRQAALWMNSPRLVFLRDEVAVTGPRERFLFKAGIGCLFPTAGKGRIRAAVGDAYGNARLIEAAYPQGATKPHPIPFTSNNLTRQVNRMLDAPYGWGGMYGNRDCSAALQDLFRPFGLWLPRNSRDQARAGHFIDLAGKSAFEKEAIISRRGIPGLSLVWLPGHIMLYVGSRGDEPLVFHNVWGLRTWSLLSGEGRAILGRGVITTLRPGEDLPSLDRPGALLVNRVEGLTLLVEQGDLGP